MVEISPQMKAKIFSLYLGCQVVPIIQTKSFHPFDLNESGLFLCGVIGSTPIIRRIAEDVRDSQSQCAILVNDISNIDADDSEEISGIASSWDNASQLKPEDVTEWIEEVMSGNCATYADYVSGEEAILLADLLRRKGYALPAYGYTVEQLIEANIFKMITN